MRAKKPPRAPVRDIAGRWATGLAGATLFCGGVDAGTAAWATGAAVVVMFAEIFRNHEQSKIPFLACGFTAAAASLLMPDAATRQAVLVLAAAAAAVSAAAWRAKLSRRRRRAGRRNRAKERP